MNEHPLRDRLQELSDAADDINALIDIAMDDDTRDQSRLDPADEFHVTIPWGKIRALDSAICAAQRELARTQGE